jgi:hypothetical protein
VHIVETKKRVLSNKHFNMLASIHNLASTYRDQGRQNEAKKLEVQVIETIKRVLSNKHLSTLASMHNLALTYRD